MLVWWEFRRASAVWGTKTVRGDSTTISSVVLTKKTVVVMALRQGRHPYATESSCWLKYPVGQGWALWIWVHIPKTFSFIYKKKEKKGIWSLGCPRAGGVIKLSFKALKAMMLCSSHKIGFGLFCSKRYRWIALTERLGIQFQPRWTNPRKPWSWCLPSLGFEKLRTPWSPLESRCSSSSNIRCSKYQVRVWAICHFSLEILCSFKAKSFNRWMLSSCEETWEEEQRSKSSTYCYII